MDMMNYIIWKYFYRKTWRNPVILMILDENPNFSQNSSKFAYSKF